MWWKSIEGEKGEREKREKGGAARAHCVARWPRFDLYLDKRYTKKELRHALERQIRETISGLDQEVILISQEDSVSRKELQAVDYVAWAIFQKYERGNDRFYRIIADKVVMEEVLQKSLW